MVYDTIKYNNKKTISGINSFPFAKLKNNILNFITFYYLQQLFSSNIV